MLETCGDLWDEVHGRMTPEEVEAEETRARDRNELLAERRKRKTTPWYASEKELERQQNERPCAARVASEARKRRQEQDNLASAFQKAAASAEFMLVLFSVDLGPCGYGVPVSCGVQQHNIPVAGRATEPFAPVGNSYTVRYGPYGIYERTVSPTCLLPLVCDGGHFLLLGPHGQVLRRHLVTLQPVGMFDVATPLTIGSDPVLSVVYREHPYSVQTSTDGFIVPVNMRSEFNATRSALIAKTHILTSTGTRAFTGVTWVGFLVNVVNMPEGARLQFVPAP